MKLALGAALLFALFGSAFADGENLGKGGSRQELPELAGGSLKSRVFRAGSWALVGHFLSLALRFAGSLILTRIFAPEIFGVLAVVLAVQVVISLLTDLGLRQAIIQSPNGGEPWFLNTAWTLQILRGWFIWSVSVLTSIGLYVADKWNFLPLGSVYASPGFPLFIVVASFSAAILGFQSMKAVTANRDLDLKRLTVIDIAAQTVSLIFVVVFGCATRSIWAYIAGGLFTSVVTVLLSHVWLPGPGDQFAWNRNALQELARFGRWTFISSTIGAAATNGDSLLLGGWVAAPVLGYYSIAKNLASVAEGVASRVYGSVSLPALSEIARLQPHRFPELLFRMRWVADSIILGCAGFLFAAGAAIVGLLYDPRYSAAGWMLQWLSFGLIFTRYGVSNSAFLALGRPEYVTAINITKLVSIFTVVPVLFYSFGVEGAVVGIAFHMLPSTAWIFYYNQRHGLNNLRLEIVALGTWTVGWLIGAAVVELLAFIKLGIANSF